MRFGVTRARIDLLKQLLEYRQALHGAGLRTGFQWINGSFVQDVEHIENRPPNDIDVVTHFYIPEGYTEETLLAAHPEVIIPQLAKSRFNMDAYPNPLGGEADRLFTQEITYWYSMWSHRRGDNAWKGFVEIDLSPQGEQEGLEILLESEMGLEGGGDEQ